MKHSKAQSNPSNEELVAEIARLKQVIRDALDYPFMSVNLHNLLKKGLHEDQNKNRKTPSGS